MSAGTAVHYLPCTHFTDCTSCLQWELVIPRWMFMLLSLHLIMFRFYYNVTYYHYAYTSHLFLVCSLFVFVLIVLSILHNSLFYCFHFRFDKIHRMLLLLAFWKFTMTIKQCHIRMYSYFQLKCRFMEGYKPCIVI